MSVTRHYTIGAVAKDAGTLKALAERLEASGVEPDSVVVLTRRGDEPLARVTLPEACVRSVEISLSRMQWFELASTYLGVTAVSVLVGAVHLATGLVVQTVMTVAVISGLIIYHRRPRLEHKILGMGLPENFAGEWESRFSSRFALALATVPEDLLESAQEAFVDESLEVPMAVDRRLVL